MGAGETIDRESADPPWRQLAAILRARIESGEITNRLPGERALQQEFDLAPVTIRKAIHHLRDQGLVVISPGMGTFVRKDLSFLPWPTGLLYHHGSKCRVLPEPTHSL
jgi:DNA-binding GntR family transcriptional regulator